MSLPHLAHPAGPDGSEDLVRAEAYAGLKGHLLRLGEYSAVGDRSDQPIQTHFIAVSPPDIRCGLTCVIARSVAAGSAACLRIYGALEHGQLPRAGCDVVPQNVDALSSPHLEVAMVRRQPAIEDFVYLGVSVPKLEADGRLLAAVAGVTSDSEWEAPGSTFQVPM